MLTGCTLLDLYEKKAILVVCDERKIGNLFKMTDETVSREAYRSITVNYPAINDGAS